MTVTFRRQLHLHEATEHRAEFLFTQGGFTLEGACGWRRATLTFHDSEREPQTSEQRCGNSATQRSTQKLGTAHCAPNSLFPCTPWTLLSWQRKRGRRVAVDGTEVAVEKTEQIGVP